MNPYKSPMLDGFLITFFQKWLGFLGDGITSSLEGVKNSSKPQREVNNTIISLIPKKEKPKSFNGFQPIAFYNSLYKFITKMLANWL